LLVLTRSEVEHALPMAACIEAMRGAMRATSERQCVLPLRQFMPIPGKPGKLGLMPGYLGGDAECFGVKIVSKFERPPGDPHGSHVGAVMLFDASSGLPVALFEGGALTAIRTAATTAMATGVLARADAKCLAVFGTGEEAWHHISALLTVRRFERLIVWGRTATRVRALLDRLALPKGVRAEAAESVEQALSQADVACTVTSAKEPFLRGQWLRPGTHLNLVGSAIATTAEVDDAAVAASKFYVDYIDAARAAAGEYLNAVKSGAVTEQHIVGEIGEVLLGRKPGRTNPSEITIYKSLGVTTQDLAAAQLALQRARELGIGRHLALDA
jgi:ornithine cyclodeaminase/alanine dehydrogenase-like protein (mu-crystallin family)